MTKKIICPECPQGCELEINVLDGQLISVSGNKCLKGETYASREITDPLRILTSVVAARGLDLKMIPARTSGPIPKSQIFKAMRLIKETTITTPIRSGDIILKDFIAPGINLIATRSGVRPRFSNL